METGSLAEQVESFRWYHTLELAPGVVTQGTFDHRPVRDRYLIPDDLSGMRCLDVATMDGFWAFELERRGAAEVVALDIENPEALDWPASLREKTEKSIDETKGARFALAKSALGSKVDRTLRSVYDLDDDLGLFDFIFCGDLLVHLKDPVTAVERIRKVCRGSAVICTPIRKFRFLRSRPIAELDGINEFEWWVFNQQALERIASAAGFARVEAGPSFELPATGGGKWRGLRGVVRAYV